MNEREPKQTDQNEAKGFTVRPEKGVARRFVALSAQLGVKRSEMARLIFARGLAVVEREGIRPQFARKGAR